MLRGLNKQALPKSDGSVYAEVDFSPDSPLWKATVVVYATDLNNVAQSPVLMSVDEDYPPNFGQPKDEVELDIGTHNIAFVNEVFAIRFRTAGTRSFITARFYGPGT